MRATDTRATIRGGQSTSDWAWPGPAELYVILIFAAAWVVISLFGGKSGFVMATATALTICALMAYLALRQYPGRMTPYIAWVVRIGAAVTAWWLFIDAPTQIIRFTAVAIYAALYLLCEWAVWRRASKPE